MSEKFSVTREIGIDMGHRVTFHGSKCRNLHGHRYTVQAVCNGSLVEAGEQEGMVIDFGFLKEEMMSVIDSVHDHGTTLWVKDNLVELFAPYLELDKVKEVIKAYGYFRDDSLVGKLTLVDFVPTAENLAKHWFNLLQYAIRMRFPDLDVDLERIDVWETPNCKASYPVK